MKIFDNLQHDRRRILERLRDESLTVRLQRGYMCVPAAFRQKVAAGDKSDLLVCTDNEIVGKPSRRRTAAAVDDECWIIFRHNITNLTTTFDILLLRRRGADLFHDNDAARKNVCRPRSFFYTLFFEVPNIYY